MSLFVMQPSYLFRSQCVNDEKVLFWQKLFSFRPTLCPTLGSRGELWPVTGQVGQQPRKEEEEEEKWEDMHEEEENKEMEE